MTIILILLGIPLALIVVDVIFCLLLAILQALHNEFLDY
jgi:hypothetical protein